MSAASGKRRLPGRAASAVLLALSALVALTACDSGSKHQAATAPGATSTALNAAQAGVRADYLAYWDAVLSANAHPDQPQSLLAAHAASTQLTMLEEALGHLRQTGLVARGPVGHDVREVDAGSATSTLVDCVQLKGWIDYEASSGRQAPGQLVDRPAELARFTLARNGSGAPWTVTYSQVLGTC